MVRQWRNCLGNTGLIPANYVKIYEEGDELSLRNSSSSSSGTAGGKRFSANTNSVGTVNEQMNGTATAGARTAERQPKLQSSCWVRVLADRWPSIYDVAALKIRVNLEIHCSNCVKFWIAARPIPLASRDSGQWDVPRREWGGQGRPFPNNLRGTSLPGNGTLEFDHSKRKLNNHIETSKPNHSPNLWSPKLIKASFSSFKLPSIIFNAFG